LIYVFSWACAVVLVLYSVDTRTVTQKVTYCIVPFPQSILLYLYQTIIKNDPVLCSLHRILSFPKQLPDFPSYFPPSLLTS